MGCAVIIHDKSGVRASWDNHTVYGWYLYISPYHYCAHVCRVKKTNTERVTDTILFEHKHITNPTVTHADQVIQSIDNLHQTVKGIAGRKGDTSIRDLEQLTAASHNLIEFHPQLANTKTQIHPSSEMAPQQQRLHTSPWISPTNRPTQSLKVAPTLPPIQYPRVDPRIPPNQAPRVAPTTSPTQYTRLAQRLPPIQYPKVIQGTPQQPTTYPISTRTQSQ